MNEEQQQDLMDRIKETNKRIKYTKKCLENLLYHRDKIVKPKSECASPEVNSMEELKMKHIPKKTKKKAELVSESVITKELNESDLTKKSSVVDDDSKKET